MGRELKRVPLDFKWPIDQIWKGYINPYRPIKCKTCGETGLNKETRKIDEEWYSMNNEQWIWLSPFKKYNDLAHCNHITEIEIDALVKAGRLWELTENRCWYDEESDTWFIYENCEKMKTSPPIFPTPQQVNEWSINSMGHDAINRWICVKARAKELGVFGYCEYCNGDGVIWQTEEIKKAHNEWKNFEPPTGDGFQLWETTSEGSPASPVFSTLDALCEWCEVYATTFGTTKKASKEDWIKMLSNDFVYHKSGSLIFL